MKKIIALAVAAAFVAPVAMAEVTLYGSVRTALEYSDVNNGGATQDVTRFRLADESSRIGFKGSDKLDSGLTVLWQAESRIRVGSANADGTTGLTTSQGWGARDSFIGLKGSFGTVKFGTRVSDVIDMATGDFMAGGGDMNDTITGFNSIIRRGASKPTNIALYESPSFNGFGFKANYDFGTTDAATDEMATGYAASVFYKSKMFDAGVAYKYNDNTTGAAVNGSAYGTPSFVNNGEYQNLIIGANVKPMAGLQVAAGYQLIKTDNGAGVDTEQDAWGVGATYQTGKFTYKLAGGQILESDGADNDGAWQVNGGVAYALSKQTQLQFGANYIENDDNGALIGTDTGISGNKGSKITAVMLGLRTDF